MPRVFAALVAVVALTTAGVPLTPAMQPRCSDCCRQGAADAPTPGCCQLAPAEQPIAREARARRSAVTPSVAVLPPAWTHVRPVRGPHDGLPAPGLRHRAMRIEVLRI